MGAPQVVAGEDKPTALTPPCKARLLMEIEAKYIPWLQCLAYVKPRRQ